MPVRWAMFHPASNAHAMLATELGVWTTTNLNEENTTWQQDIAGLANVRVDMLQIRTADYTVIAATHGRGLATAVWDIGMGLEDQGGMEAWEQGSVELWPNPTRGVVSLQSAVVSQVSAASGQQSAVVEILDLHGKVIETFNNRTMEQRNSGTMELDITHLPAGIYFVKISSSDSQIVKRIVKL